LVPTLCTQWSLRVSNRVQSEQLKITGNNFKTWRLAFLQKVVLSRAIRGKRRNN